MREEESWGLPDSGIEAIGRRERERETASNRTNRLGEISRHYCGKKSMRARHEKGNYNIPTGHNHSVESCVLPQKIYSMLVAHYHVMPRTFYIFVSFEDKCEHLTIGTILCGEEKLETPPRGTVRTLNNLSPRGRLRGPRGLLSLATVNLILEGKPTN